MFVWGESPRGIARRGLDGLVGLAAPVGSRILFGFVTHSIQHFHYSLLQTLISVR